jgi:NAD(P)-dependent dehydrogenase (short-subunit alcohol dehydrogenase family)
MTKALALDEAKHGVRVNVISPGECTGPRPADTGAQDCWLVVLRTVTPSVDNAAGQAPPSSAAHHSDVALLAASHMAVRCVPSFVAGNVWTPLWEEHVAGDDAAIKAGEAQQPMGRMGRIEEVRR